MTALSPAQLAKRWECSTTLVYDLLNAGTLQGFRLGKLWRIPVATVEAYEDTPAEPVAPVQSAEIAPDRPAMPDAATVNRVARMNRLGAL